MPETDIKKIIAIAKDKFWIVIITTFLGLACSFLYLRYTIPQYQAFSTIKVDKKEEGGLGDFYKKFDIGGGAKDELLTEIEIVKSRTLTEKAIRRLNLNVSYYSDGRFKRMELYKKSPFTVNYAFTDSTLRDQEFSVEFKDETHFSLENKSKIKPFKLNGNELGKPIKLHGGEITLVVNPVNDRILAGASFIFTINSFRSLVGNVNSGLTVERLGKDVSIFKISYKDAVPEKAQDIVNTLSQVYINESLKQKSEQASLTINFIDQQLGNVSTDLKTSENNLQQFKKNNNLINISSEAGAVVEKMGNLEVEKTKLEVQMAVLNSIATYVNKNEDFNNVSPSFSSDVDPTLLKYIEDLKQMQLQYALLSSSNTSVSPEMVQIGKTINIARETILENIKNAQKNLKVEYESVSSIIDNFKKSFSNLPENERNFIDLTRDQVLHEKIYSYLIEKRSESEITKAATISPKRILDSALVPLRPVFPDRTGVLIKGLLLGIGLGCGLIYLLVLLKNTFTSLEELEAKLHTPVMGVIAKLEDAKSMASLVVADNPKSAISESFRSVRSNLKFLVDEDKTMVISTTSSTSGEGKTFFSINLGAVMAMLDKKVIIVDMDLRKPKIHIGFDVNNTIGTSNYLIGKANIDDVIRHSKVNGLDFITAGDLPPNPSELIISERKEELLNTLKERYDVVFFDTPPVGLVSDSISLIQKSDVALYVIRANYSKLFSTKIVDKLREDYSLKNLYVIFNAVSLRNSSYGYGYGYGYYSDDQVKKKSFFKRLFRRG